MTSLSCRAPKRAPERRVAGGSGRRRAPVALTDLQPYEHLFWSKVDQSGEHWRWTGAIRNGHGVWTFPRNRQIRVSQAILLLTGQDRPSFRALTRRTCDVAGCIRHYAWTSGEAALDRRGLPDSTPTLTAQPETPATPTPSSSEWEREALCATVDNPDVFFPERADEARAARRFCAPCPVQRQCGEAAVARGEEYGVWAGMTERQLRKVVRLAGTRREAVAA